MTKSIPNFSNPRIYQDWKEAGQPAAEGIEAKKCEDYEYWLTNHAVIETEKGQILSFKDAGGLTRGQRKTASLRYHSQHVWEDEFTGIITLKSRQQGITTEEQAYQYWDSKYNGKNGTVIAHTSDAAQYIFEKWQRYRREDKFAPPKTSQSSVRRVVFEDRPGRYEVTTAGSPEALRSRNIHNIHESECAYYGENGSKLERAIAQFRGLKYVHKESTAKGEDPVLYPSWTKAERYCKLTFIEDEEAPFGFKVERKILDEEKWNKYYPNFLSVLDDDRVHFSVTNDQEDHIVKTADDEEKWLLTEIKAPISFLVWRRSALYGPQCEGDINTLHQEYPVTAEQAYIMSGSPRFDHNLLNQMPVIDGARGFLKPGKRWTSDQIEFVPDQKADLVVFQKPQNGHRYVMSIDPSQGLDSENPSCEFCSGDRDESSVIVADIDAPEGIKQVALLAGSLNEEELIDPCLLMAQWYNMAFVCIERVGGYGDALMIAFKNRYEAQRLYKMYGSKSAGLKVHHGNRTQLLNQLAASLHRKELWLTSKRTVHQMKQVKRTAGGKYEAAAGHHDDDVSALWGIIAAAEEFPEYLNPVEQNFAFKRRREREMERHNDFQNPDPMGFY